MSYLLCVSEEGSLCESSRQKNDMGETSNRKMTSAGLKIKLNTFE